MDTKKLHGKLVEKGFSMASMARELGISETTMYNKMSGKTEFTQGEMHTMASRLQMSMQEISAIFFADQVS